MKPLFALLLLASSAVGQTLTCPPGTSLSGGLATSGAVYELGCRTPEQKTKADLWFAEVWCGEMGLGSFLPGAGLSYSSHSHWKDGHCEQYEQWEKRIGEHMQSISEAEYNSIIAWLSYGLPLEGVPNWPEMPVPPELER